MSPVLNYEADNPDAAARRPLVELLLLAVPTVAQMASYTTMQFLDTWMLARLGVREPTAAGNGGLFAWSVIGLGVGVVLCVNTLVSQNFGQKDYAACGRFMWQGLWFSLLFGLVAWPLVPVGPRMFGWLGHDATLAKLEGDFFRITVGWAPVVLASRAFGQFLVAVNRPWVVMLAAVAGVLVNLGVNYLLIFGNLGFPRMGVAGAAWATNVGTTVELVVLAAIALAPRVRARFNTGDWVWRPALMRTFVAIGVPSGLQLVADIAAWALFQNWVIGRFDTAAMAANMFMFRYMSVSFMPAFGISTAVTALVGRYIGAGKPDVAVRRAHLGFAVGGAYMLLCGIGYFVGRNALMGLFSTDAEVLRIGAMLMVFAGVYQVFDAMYIVYNGALRGAGDTFVPAVALFVLCWGITVLGGYVVARWRPDWGLVGPWTMATIYGVILGAFSMRRFVRGRWRAISLDREEAVDKVAALEVVSSQ